MAIGLIDISDLYGTAEICRTKHYVTYGGGPEGGFVFFGCAPDPGWYKWHRDWFKKATYAKVEAGQVAFLMHADGSEQIAILPDDWDTTVNLEELAETVLIADDDFMLENESL